MGAYLLSAAFVRALDPLAEQVLECSPVLQVVEEEHCWHHNQQVKHDIEELGDLIAAHQARATSAYFLGEAVDAAQQTYCETGSHQVVGKLIDIGLQCRANSRSKCNNQA